MVYTFAVDFKVKMRTLHWTTVNPDDAKKTIWGGIDDSKIEFDTKDLESKFCWKQVESSKPKEAAKSVKKKNQTVRVLEIRRAYNIEVCL